MAELFSDRHGFREPDSEINVRHEAPDELRGIVVDIALESGLNPNSLRRIVCHALFTTLDRGNWSDGNVEEEVRGHLEHCQWYHVYDAIENIHTQLSKRGELTSLPGGGGSVEGASYFADRINRYFRLRGIGWQLTDDGRVEVRGPESFENVVHGAQDVLESTGRNTASGEISEAIRDLSRRPDPDVTGAIQHAMAAMECVARDVTGDTKSTLGEVLKRNPGVLPTPIDGAVEKTWGYSSEMGRHLREGRSPGYDEAEFVVGLSGTVCRYLARKYPER